MNQAAYQEMTKMLTGFPQSQADIMALLLTYDEDLTGISDQAIVETAQRYRRGDIPDQNKTFAPSIAEFVTSSRRQEEIVAIRSRPRLQAPPVRPLPASPPEQRRTDEERARQAERMARFHAAEDSEKAKAKAAERAEIRQRYGMTTEVLASMKDQPLPKGMVQVGQAIPRHQQEAAE